MGPQDGETTGLWHNETTDWKIIFLILGMLALGMALEKTRGAALVSHTLIRGLGGWGRLVVLCIVYLP